MRVASTLLLASFLAGCPADGPHRRGPGQEPEPGTKIDRDKDGSYAGVDCDDEDETVFPGAVDVPYDGIDQDCEGGDVVDADGDGAKALEVGGDDCDDQDPLTLPGAPDTVGDGVDQSCDGADGVDVDRDGHAGQPSGGDDCDDADPAVHPGAQETWYDGFDQDCDGACEGDQDGDGSVIEGWTVLDGDACDVDVEPDQASAPTDCDDTNPLAEAVLLSVSPEGGSISQNPWREVRATLYEVDASGVLVVTDGAGEPVAGVSSWSGSTLIFTPEVDLTPLASYTAQLTWGCGTEAWAFTTADGTAQDFLHTWTVGPPDTLQIEIVNPVATLYGFGMAETGPGTAGWYGEDCAGALSSGSCHPMRTDGLLLQSVQPYVGSVVPGLTTLFDATFDAGITYYVEARTGPESGACWAWGDDPAYFSGCEPL